MSTSTHQNQSQVAGHKLSAEQRSERLRATMKVLEGLLLNEESLKRQRFELAAALFRASIP